MASKYSHLTTEYVHTTKAKTYVDYLKAKVNRLKKKLKEENLNDLQKQAHKSEIRKLKFDILEAKQREVQDIYKD